MEIADLLAFAMEQQASDLHVSADLPPLLRIHGDIRPIAVAPLAHADVRAMLYAVMSDPQRRQYADTQDCDFAFALPELGRFRVNAFVHSRGAGAVFRLIPTQLPSLTELGAPPVLAELARRPRGLILVTGPTGSGKSTTLAAMLQQINHERHAHILTIEDPIEFIHPSGRSLIHQREVHTHTQGFSQALRSALREDPDVILVGEMRDVDTMRLALTAAETGHLVLASLHTQSAVQTVDRVVDSFPAAERAMVRSVLAESLQAVVAQTLLKPASGHGRVAAFEVMLASPAIRHQIRDDKVAQMYSTLQTSQALGMQTLDQALQQLVQRQQISPAGARQHALDKTLFPG